jgi:hypothetical protein
MIKENFSNFIDNLQKDITSSLEIIDEKKNLKVNIGIGKKVVVG